MAFPTGWDRKCKITIPDAQIVGNNSDFPITITKAILPTESMEAGSNSALNGGGDVRFSEDSAGSTQLACEIVEFITSATESSRSAEIHVKMPALNTGAARDLYVWYKKVGESQPAVTDTYGRNAVWSNSFDAVFHMQESSGDFINSVGDGDDATMPTDTSGITRSAAGAFGAGCIDLDGSQDTIAISSSDPGPWHDSFTEVTLSAWVTRGSVDAAGPNIILDEGGDTNGAALYYRSTPNTLHFGASENGNDTELDSTSTISESSAFVLLHGTFSVGSIALYVDGSSEATGSMTSSVPAHLDAPGIGAPASTTAGSSDAHTAWSGKIDELRRSSVARSADWRATEHNNQSDPGAFVSPGTPESTSGGGSDWSHDRTGVANSDIDEITGVPLANIDEITGV